jgi:hypothetical protein
MLWPWRGPLGVGVEELAALRFGDVDVESGRVAMAPPSRPPD